MKINQVEELTGITKKNIRFYEEQKLINPQRNPANGYREYSMEDVKQLSLGILVSLGQRSYNFRTAVPQLCGQRS